MDPEVFSERGYVILEELVPPDLCDALNVRLEAILKGDYDLGAAPSKAPSAKELRRFQSGQATVRVVDAWKCDRLFRSLVLSPRLGALAARLGRWRGARVAEDQVWIKPPGAGPLVFHRDSPYFDFEPEDVITIWIALDSMSPEIGPLEYVVASHRWGDGRRGTAAQFFDPQHKQLMEDAARKEGLDPHEVSVVPVLVQQGGAGLHDGRLWHGSGANRSRRCRRGGER
ncbi:unnamed protein product [Effrenium voratum]|nr:unnamed protein product [Effrenium voratum]